MKKIITLLDRAINQPLGKYWIIPFGLCILMLLIFIWSLFKIPGYAYIEPIMNIIYCYSLLFCGIVFILGMLSTYLLEKYYKEN